MWDVGRREAPGSVARARGVVGNLAYGTGQGRGWVAQARARHRPHLKKRGRCVDRSRDFDRCRTFLCASPSTCARGLSGSEFGVNVDEEILHGWESEAESGQPFGARARSPASRPPRTQKAAQTPPRSHSARARTRAPPAPSRSRLSPPPHSPARIPRPQGGHPWQPPQRRVVSGGQSAVAAPAPWRVASAALRASGLPRANALRGLT